jgi:hypothetical protein
MGRGAGYLVFREFEFRHIHGAIIEIQQNTA